MENKVKAHIEVIETDLPFLFDAAYAPASMSFLKHALGCVSEHDVVDALLLSALLEARTPSRRLHKIAAILTVEDVLWRQEACLTKEDIESAFKKVVEELERKNKKSPNS
jgi:hypothetical protein